MTTDGARSVREVAIRKTREQLEDTLGLFEACVFTTVAEIVRGVGPASQPVVTDQANSLRKSVKNTLVTNALISDIMKELEVSVRKLCDTVVQEVIIDEDIYQLQQLAQGSGLSTQMSIEGWP